MIPDAAVEAAYSRIADNLDDTETESWKGLLRDALEAAAPHMLAGVRERNYAGLHAIAELGSDDPAEPFRKATK